LDYTTKIQENEYSVYHVFENSSGKPNRSYNTQITTKTFKNMLKTKSEKVVK